MLRIACLQTHSGNDFAANLATLTAMAREAAARGAQFIFSPEYVLMMDGSGRTMRENALDAGGEPALSALAALSRELGAWHLVGSLTLKSGDGRMFNRSLLISDRGEVVAAYDKIH
ncbi:MAG: nitrilase-related carbon-nitrogen hydrolase, partial [Burkholderiales bacterium]